MTSIVVTQLHVTSWPLGGTPPTSTVLELVEHVNKVQMSSGNKAITVTIMQVSYVTVFFVSRRILLYVVRVALLHYVRELLYK